MTKQKTKESIDKFVDVGFSGNNGVTSMQVTNPDLIERLHCKGFPYYYILNPLLFYCGKNKIPDENQKVIVGRDKEGNPKYKTLKVTYLSQQEFKTVKEKIRQEGEFVDKYTNERGREIEIPHSGYVPFSFGAGHIEMLEKAAEFGIDKFIAGRDLYNAILSCLEERAKDEEKRKAQEDKKIGNKIKKILGLYK